MASPTSGLRVTKRDNTTFSNYTDFTSRAMHFDWDVDFESKTISGTVAIDVVSAGSSTDKLVLDTRSLDIHKVEVGGKEAKYELGEPHAIFGAPLTVHLPPEACAKGAEVTVVVTYRTSPSCTALAWMGKENTVSGHPFLFSQCQAIHARSLFPCQDTPGIRATYTATARVPAGLTVLMSALMKTSEIIGNVRTTTFEQPVPIVSCLVAIAVANLEKKDISERVAVWAEPSLVDLAASDFSETEGLLACAEQVLGPYIWTRYDILVLPGAFQLGGMENPCLTFVTPALLTGDKSMVDVISHEVAHSWTGNSVGPTTWEDFYLNEGFTMFLERKLMALMRDPGFFNLSAIVGRSQLKYDVGRYGEDHPYTCLRPDLHDVDPDDVYSNVPYEKGFALLCYLQGIVGEEMFMQWMKDYITTYAHQSISSFELINHITEYFASPEHKADISQVDWKAWMDKPGMPPVEVEFKSELMDRVTETVQHWLTHRAPPPSCDFSHWLPLQKCIMLNRFLDSSRLVDVDLIDKIDTEYHFTSCNHADVLGLWIRLCTRVGWKKHEKVMEEFLRKYGRMKYVLPIFRELKARDPERALELYEENKNRYHPICKKALTNAIRPSRA